MDDFERFFSFMEVISKPGAAAKVAADMKKLKEQEVANKAILKEAKAESYAAAEERKRLTAEWVEVKNARAAVAEENKAALAERQVVNNMKNAAVEEVIAKKAELKEIESNHGRKISELRQRIESLEKQAEMARGHKMEIEAEYEALRRKVG